MCQWTSPTCIRFPTMHAVMLFFFSIYGRWHWVLEALLPPCVLSVLWQHYNAYVWQSVSFTEKETLVNLVISRLIKGDTHLTDVCSFLQKKITVHINSMIMFSAIYWFWRSYFTVRFTSTYLKWSMLQNTWNRAVGTHTDFKSTMQCILHSYLLGNFENRHS